MVVFMVNSLQHFILYDSDFFYSPEDQEVRLELFLFLCIDMNNAFYLRNYRDKILPVFNSLCLLLRLLGTQGDSSGWYLPCTNWPTALLPIALILRRTAGQNNLHFLKLFLTFIAFISSIYRVLHFYYIAHYGYD